MGHRFHRLTARLLHGLAQWLKTEGGGHRPCTGEQAHLVHGDALPASADRGDVGGELNGVVNLSVVVQGRDACSVHVHDGVQGAVVPRLRWQSDVGLSAERQRRRRW